MKAQSPSYWVVIPAAGVGKRMRADRPKQYLLLGGKSVIEHTLDRFSSHPAIKGMVVVLDANDRHWSALHVKGKTRLYTAIGGPERCYSVLSGLEYLSTFAHLDDWVLVHDAVRPCLARQDLDTLIHALEDDSVGGILAVPVRDTIKRTNGERGITGTVDRQDLWHALTPQMFRLEVLRRAISHSLDEGIVVTDEASAIEHIGLTPRLVEGQASNIKITGPEDLALAEYYLNGTKSGANPT